MGVRLLRGEYGCGLGGVETRDCCGVRAGMAGERRRDGDGVQCHVGDHNGYSEALRKRADQMSTLKTVGIATAVLATGLLGYGIYKALQEDEPSCAADDAAEWDDEMEDEEEEADTFDEAEDDVVYG